MGSGTQEDRELGYRRPWAGLASRASAFAQRRATKQPSPRLTARHLGAYTDKATKNAFLNMVVTIADCVALCRDCRDGCRDCRYFVGTVGTIDLGW